MSRALRARSCVVGYDKPHLMRVHGNWYCLSTSGPDKIFADRLGWGGTIEIAYREWRLNA